MAVTHGRTGTPVEIDVQEPEQHDVADQDSSDLPLARQVDAALRTDSANETQQLGKRRADHGEATAAKRKRPASSSAHSQQVDTALQTNALRLSARRGVANGEQIERAIEAQNAMIGRLGELYISADRTTATTQPGDGTIRASRHGEPVQLRILSESISARFATETHFFDVQLVTQPHLDPRASETPEEVGRQRVTGPYQITRISERREGTDLGRATRHQRIAWAPNPNYRGFIMPGPGPVPMIAQRQVLQTLRLPPERELGQLRDSAEYQPVPVADDQPYTLYVHRDDVGGGEPARELPSLDQLMRTIENGVDLESPEVMSQTARSQRPQVNRRTGGRQPNTAMGGSAWELAPNGTGGSRGTLASHEWCHLIGDADGGACAPENLVIGTNAVNTQQLALENNLRARRPALRELGWDIYIRGSASGTLVAGHDGTSVLHAEHILYEVWLQPQGSEQRADVGQHVLDANRGPITLQEFETAGRMLGMSLDVAIARIREGRRGHAVADDRAPWAFPGEDVSALNFGVWKG